MTVTLEMILRENDAEIYRQTVVLPENADQARWCAKSGPQPRDRGLVQCNVCGVEKPDDEFRYPSGSGKRAKSCQECRTKHRPKLLSIGAMKGHVTRQLQQDLPHKTEWTKVKKIADDVLSGATENEGDVKPPPSGSVAPDGFAIKKLPPAFTDY